LRSARDDWADPHVVSRRRRQRQGDNRRTVAALISG
jgi:hypothetical protein